MSNANRLANDMNRHKAITGQAVKKITVREDVYYRLRKEFFQANEPKPTPSHQQSFNGARLEVRLQDPEWVLWS